MKKTIIFVFTLTLLIFTGCSADDGVILSGTIEGDEIPVIAQISGEIVSIDHDEGDYVTPKDRLAKIDDQRLKLQYNEAEAALGGAAAKWEQAKTHYQDNLQQLAARVNELESLLDGANETLSFQQKQLEKMKLLYAENAVTEKELDAQKELYNQAATKVEQLSAQHQAAKVQYQAAQNQYDIAYLEAAKKQAQSRLEQIKLSLDKTNVYSPVSGVVLRRYIEPGEPVKEGSALFTILNTEKLEIIVYLPEAQLNLAQVGKTVDLKVNAYPDQTFHGKIKKISNQAEFTPKNIQTGEERAKTVFAVTVELTDGDKELKPGMSADVILSNEG